MTPDRASALLAEASDIEQEEAARAGQLGYLARLACQCGLPHREPGVQTWSRRCGFFRLYMAGPLGLPYGLVPRRLLVWICTEAVQTRSPRLELGRSLSAFLRELDMDPTGGKHGTIRRLREQMRRLFAASISGIWDAPDHFAKESVDVVASADVWWASPDPRQVALWSSWIELSPSFYRLTLEHAVPLDLRVVRFLRSPLALDLYAWAAWRSSFLEAPKVFPWLLLEDQFGAGYGRSRDFRSRLARHAGELVVLAPRLEIAPGEAGLSLSPVEKPVKKL
jgi:hypothetical protein